MSNQVLNDALARRLGDGRIEFRDEPLRVRIELNNLTTADHHDVRCAFDCSVRVADSNADRRLLEEMLMRNGASAGRAEVAKHIASAIVDPARGFIEKRPADSLLAGDGRGELLEMLRKAADGAAFACGLVVLPPFQLQVESPSLQRQKIELMQRARAEQRSAEQVEHLRRAGELLKQFQSLRESASSIAPGQILQQISPADRGTTLEALLLASSQTTRQTALWAVAGPYLIKIASDGGSTELIALPPTLGPLRSVQPATIDSRPQLLVGARDGVMVVAPDSPSDPCVYPSRRDGSPMGFNRAVYDESSRAIWASHKDYGLLRWDLNSAEVRSIENTADARNVQVLGAGRIAFTIGGVLHTCSDSADSREATPRATSATTAAILALALDNTRGILVHDDGTVETIDRESLDTIDTTLRPARLSAAAQLPWLGSLRLLLATESGAIDCVGVDDQLVTQYLSGPGGHKIIAANEATVASVSGDRQRLVLWHAWDGRKPFAHVHLTALTRHRIADIEYG